MKNILLMILLFCTNNIFAQVVIGKDTPKTNNSELELISTDGQKALILPKTNDRTTLPKYKVTEVDSYTDDPSMEGMLLYNKAEKKVKVYDGKKWENAFDDSPKVHTITRMKMVPETIVCALGICGSNEIKFSSGGENFSDHLNIQTASDTFTIKQKGVYRINVNIGFSGFSLLGQNIKIAISVNGNARTYMSKSPKLFSSDTYVAGDEVVLYLNTGDQVKIKMTLGTSIAAGFKYGENDYSNITFERLL